MIVLLTATVTPQSRQLLTVVDPVQRADEYRASIGWWIRMSSRAGFRLAIAENSGYPVEALLPARTAPPRHVSLIPVAPPTSDEVSRGKGASEGSLIRQALPSLELDPHEFLFKVTGRLALRNFPRCVPRTDANTVGVVDIPRTDRRWIDSRAFGGTRVFWESHLSRLGSTADDRIGRNFEHELAAMVEPHFTQGPRRVVNFAEKPWFVGRSGTTGKPYGDGIGSVIRHSLLMPLDRTRRAFDERPRHVR